MENIEKNYYIDVAEKFFSSWCTNNGFSNILEFSKTYLKKDDLGSIIYSYIINYSLFLFNYEKVNKQGTKSFYITIRKSDLEKIIYDCKQREKDDYQTNDWNKLKIYKIIKNVVIDYCDLINESYEVLKFEDKNSIIDYLINSYDKFVDNGKYKMEKVYPLFDDLIGLEDAKNQIREKIIDPILYKDIYAKYDISVGGGILLYGLPGTGKTMFAQAVANEIDGYFVSIKSSDLKSKWYGDTELKIRTLFEDARKHEISVIFFDEFEAIGVSRDKYGAEITAETIVPELLAQMQGFEQTNQTILVIAATNRPWDIDSALLRPGRFDSLIYISLPDTQLRLKMFKKNLLSINVEEDILEYLSSATENYNGADIKKISDSLIRKVINKEIDNIKNYQITFEDCVDVLKNIKSSVSIFDLENMKKFKESNK